MMTGRLGPSYHPQKSNQLQKWRVSKLNKLVCTGDVNTDACAVLIRINAHFHPILFYSFYYSKQFNNKSFAPCSNSNKYSIISRRATRWNQGSILNDVLGPIASLPSFNMFINQTIKAGIQRLYIQVCSQDCSLYLIGDDGNYLYVLLVLNGNFTYVLIVHHSITLRACCLITASAANSSII